MTHPTDIATAAALTKKARILQAFDGGEQDLPGYYDLYTSTARAMNAYAPKFRGKMRFKDAPSARRSVEVIERAYQDFEAERDRAGQHHAMALALTMMNRAWASGKFEEAAHFARWFEEKIAPLTRRQRPVPGANTDQEREVEAPDEQAG